MSLTPYVNSVPLAKPANAESVNLAMLVPSERYGSQVRASRPYADKVVRVRWWRVAEKGGLCSDPFEVSRVNVTHGLWEHGVSYLPSSEPT